MESQGIELIDASVAEDNYRSFLMHNYFHRDPWVSSDIGAFILGKAPWERNLTKETDDVFWAFPDDYPDQLRTRAALPKTINFSDDTLPLSAPVH
jgi:hypothetical protein